MAIATWANCVQEDKISADPIDRLIAALWRARPATRPIRRRSSSRPLLRRGNMARG